MHKPRDEIRGDLLDGRPTLSAKADALALNVARLLSGEEARALWERLDSTADHSSAWSQWMNPPYRYLADFDAGVVAEIETYLEDLYQHAREQARARGWEVEG
jgi:hypothetical protein